MPGVNREALAQIFQSNQLLGLLEPAVGRRAAELLGDGDGRLPVHHGVHHHPVADSDHPALEALQKEGDAGRKKLNQYTNLADDPAGAAAGVRAGALLAQPVTAGGAPVLSKFGFRTYPLADVAVILITLTAGTMLAMWLGQMITEEGIGNGVSIIIFGGIVAAHAGEHPANLRCKAASCSCWSSSS